MTAIDPTLDRILERPDGVSGMLSEQRSAERWCLLRRSAWTTERIERVRALNTDAASDNALDLVRLLADAGENARPGKYGVDHRELDAMAADREISDAVWTMLTRRPLNMRFFTSVEKMRTALEERRGAPLPEPVWWARVRAIRDATAVRKQQEAADEDEEPAIEAEEDQEPSGD